MAQEVQAPWTQVLPIALIRILNTPGQLNLTPFEKLYGRPFLSCDIVLDTESQILANCVTHLAAYQQVLSELLTVPTEKGEPLFSYHC